MHSDHRFRALSVLLILALLLAPWLPEAKASEAPPRTEATASHPVDLVIGWLMALLGDEGCTWAPNGTGCRESPDNGCGWDPNGDACRESLDNGCTWDPNGGCRESLDNGCTWDPDGRCLDNG